MELDNNYTIDIISNDISIPFGIPLTDGRLYLKFQGIGYFAVGYQICLICVDSLIACNFSTWLRRFFLPNVYYLWAIY